MILFDVRKTPDLTTECVIQTEFWRYISSVYVGRFPCVWKNPVETRCSDIKYCAKHTTESHPFTWCVQFVSREANIQYKLDTRCDGFIMMMHPFDSWIWSWLFRAQSSSNWIHRPRENMPFYLNLVAYCRWMRRKLIRQIQMLIHVNLEHLWPKEKPN